MLMMSSNDVQWCRVPGCKNLIATAATTSAVVVWDVEAERKTERRKALQAHQRAANAVAWHNTPFCLLSASQDGTIHYWDVRVPEQPSIIIQPRSEAVRAIDFNQFYGNYFAAAFDNGTVQAWDIRKPITCERRITAHDGLVLSVVWHPQDSSILASGGRDGCVKVWDLNVATKPIHQIQTISAVGKVCWRPKSMYQICSSAAILDNQMHIWDLHRPFVPFASLVGHNDVITGMIWPHDSVQEVITASKDGKLIVHKVRESFFPSQRMKATPFSWNHGPGDFQIAMVPQKLVRGNPEDMGVSKAPDHMGATFASGMGAKSPLLPGKEKIVMSSIPPVLKAKGLGPSFVTLATRSKLQGGSHRELCEWNSNVCREAGRSDLCPIWEIVSALLDGELAASDADAEEDVADSQVAPFLTPYPRNRREVVSNPSISGSSSSGSGGGSTFQSSGMPSRSLPKTVRGIAAAAAAMGVPTSSSDDDGMQATSGHSFVAGADELPIGDVLSSDSEERPSKSGSRKGGGGGGGVGSGGGGGGGMGSVGKEAKSAGGAAAANDSDSDDLFRENSPVNVPLDLDALREATREIQQGPGILLAPSAYPVVATSPPRMIKPPTTSDLGFPAVASLDALMDAEAEGGGVGGGAGSTSARRDVVDIVVRSASVDWGIVAAWDPLAALEPMFSWFTEQGDVQTLFHLVLVVGITRLLRTSWCTDRMMKQWCVHYLDLLSQLQLWTVRNEILRAVTWEDLRENTKTKTVFHASCPFCKQGLTPSSFQCDSCKRVVCFCSLCHLPVRGLLMWCQVCGHGGHALEMRNWWQGASKTQKRMCPEPSCTHMCSSLSSGAGGAGTL